MPDQPIYYDSAELKQKLEQKLDILDHIRYNDEYGKYLGEDLIEKHPSSKGFAFYGCCLR